MNPNKEKHLIQLIAKFYNISRQRYNGKTFDNVLNIFDDLSLDEQKLLIQGVLGVYAASASGLIHDKELIDHGDVSKLLEYLRVLQIEVHSGQDMTVSDNNQTKPKVVEKKDEGMDKIVSDNQVQNTTTIAVGFIVAVLGFIFLIALSDNPDHIQKLNYIKHLYDIIVS